MSQARTVVHGGQHVAQRVGRRNEAARHLDVAHVWHRAAVASNHAAQLLMEIDDGCHLCKDTISSVSVARPMPKRT